MPRSDAVRLVRREIRRRLAAVRSRVAQQPVPPGLRLTPRLGPFGRETLSRLPLGVVAALCEHYLEHRFDLLGSGWVRVRHGMTCRGVEGHRYPPRNAVRTEADGRWLSGLVPGARLADSRRVWSLVDEGYEPIDWQLDFKSGFRWDARRWHWAARRVSKPGVDIKVPWELARMQHLPQLATAAALSEAGEPGFRPPQVYAAEFRNQVLDFVAANPCGWGVNWTCAMDVAIRAVNWLVAYDLFRAHGTSFDEAFETEIARGVYQHAHHIAHPANLEWNPVLRANHYLADVVGLLFCAAYLPRSPRTDGWLSWAVSELTAEVGMQFHAEGSNFEGSTSYHRLSAEMAAYGVALVLGFGESLPEECMLRLERAAEFSVAVTAPDGRVAQVGDNDSGRLLKAHPVFTTVAVREMKARFANLDGYAELPDEAHYLFEDATDHRPLVSGVGELFGREDLVAAADGPHLDGALLLALSGGVRARGQGVGRGAAPVPGAGHSGRRGLRLRLPVSPGVVEGLEGLGYPDFGLYVYRSPRLFLCVRCGPVGQGGSGGHSHNDQLALELWVDGHPVVRDPGTYLYTPLPARRRGYRSVRAHFAPRLGEGEPGDIDLGVFGMRDRTRAECLHFDDRVFVGRHHGFGVPVVREIRLGPEAIEITDFVEGEGELVPPQRGIPISPGYGWVCRDTLSWEMDAGAWTLER